MLKGAAVCAAAAPGPDGTAITPPLPTHYEACQAPGGATPPSVGGLQAGANDGQRRRRQAGFQLLPKGCRVCCIVFVGCHREPNCAAAGGSGKPHQGARGGLKAALAGASGAKTEAAPLTGKFCFGLGFTSGAQEVARACSTQGGRSSRVILQVGGQRGWK